MRTCLFPVKPLKNSMGLHSPHFDYLPLMNSIAPQPGGDAQYTKSIYALLSRSIV